LPRPARRSETAPPDFTLQLASTTPLREIDGVPHAIWTYALTWTGPSGATPIDIGPRIAIELPARIAIRDPREFPDVPSIQSTSLVRSGSGDLQRVVRDARDGGGGSLSFSFVAPAKADAFTPARLARQAAPAAPWVVVPFRTFPDALAATQQLISGPAFVCPTGAGPNPLPVLEHSTRSLLKATVGSFLPNPLAFPGFPTGDALVKHRFARQLILQPNEVQAVKHLLEARSPTVSVEGLSPRASIWHRLALFEVDPSSPSSAPPLDTLGAVPLDALRTFGDALSELREGALAAARAPAPVTPLPTPAGAGELAAGHAAPARATPASASGSPARAADPRLLQPLARAAVIATKGLSLNTDGRGVQPIGYMNLERLEMAPAGIVRGELIATIPLAPLEETAVIQKEWSVTSREFTSIVTDSLENVSETGVTDNTELAQSVSSQNQHSNQFNITGTVSGGIDQIFDASASSGFTAQDASSATASSSTKHSAAVTQKASSRAKKEHKVTISTTTVTGTSESTTRSLKNADPVNPIRIDYFRMMREWRVRLYRYGLRLTYDLVVAEPGGAFRQAHAYLGWLKSQVGPFQFGVAHFPPDYVKSKSDANYATILKLADRFNAQIPPFPEPPPSTTVSKLLSQGMPAGDVADDVSPPIDVPVGFWIEQLLFSLRLRNVNAAARVLFSSYPEQVNKDPNGTNFGPVDLCQFGLLRHAAGQVLVYVSHHDNLNSGFLLEPVYSPTEQTIANWLNDVWTALFNAAQTQYYGQQQDIASKIQQLEERLSNVDTLTLRREESEEIMKLAVATLVGNYAAQFWGIQDVYAWLANLFEANFGWPPIVDPTTPFAPGLSIDPRPIGAAFTRVSSPEVYPLLPLVDQNEITARFVNQAIEWENVVTFLYSYCWDIPESWDFVRNLQHADATRQAFLRAGSARVVLTVRKGWERMWNAFVQTGLPYYDADTDPAGNAIPYMTIAQEIAAYDDRNYPGIPPANPGQSAVRLEESVYTTSATPLSPSTSIPLTDVEIEVTSSAGFQVGALVVLDSGVGDAVPPGAPGRQESTTISAIRASDTTHLTLSSVQCPHGQNGQPYSVVQPGEKGVLISEWNEYTPTSGSDIAVTSNLQAIA
jgi:hypothetical protein